MTDPRWSQQPQYPPNGGYHPPPPQPYYPPYYYRPRPMRDGWGIASLTVVMIGFALEIIAVVLLRDSSALEVAVMTNGLIIVAVLRFVCYIAAIALGAYGRHLYAHRQASGQTAASWGMGLGIVLLIFSGVALLTI